MRELQLGQSRSSLPARPILPLDSPPLSSQGSDQEPDSEWLREKNDRLEARQVILEAHNKPLERQLHRLRLLLKKVRALGRRCVHFQGVNRLFS